MLKIYRGLPAFKGKLTLGRRLFKGIIYQNKSIEFTCHNNIKYRIPHTQEIIGIELLINGIYEPDVINFIKKNINDGDTFFDVGANIGSIALPVIMQRKAIRYYGFEASPFVFDYLKTNFEINKIQHYQLHNNLIGAENRNDVKFYESIMDYGKSSSAPTYRKTHMLVTEISLDCFCASNKISNIDFIKVDVQGFEKNVFKGMRQLLLNRQIKNILFEFEAWAEDEAGFKSGEAQQYLLDCDYELFDIKGKKLDSILESSQSPMIWSRPKR